MDLEFDIHQIANGISFIGTCIGLTSRIPQVYKTYTTRSAKDLSEKTLALNVTANSCFLFYTSVNLQYALMMNCFMVITLEYSLIYMKYKFKHLKKSSSSNSLLNLNDLVDDSDTEF